MRFIHLQAVFLTIKILLICHCSCPAARVKNIADAIFFTQDVCVEAPQTSCDCIGEIVFTIFTLTMPAHKVLRHAAEE